MISRGRTRGVLGLTAALLLIAAAANAHADAPKVVKATPADGDMNVDPKLREIRIEFDQDMSPDAWSVVGGGPKFPKLIGKPRWETPRVFVWRCKLKPGHDYWFSINSQTYKNFRSKRGQPAEPYAISFRTAGESDDDDEDDGTPRVVKAIPDNGDADVDPGLDEIRIEFSVDMSPGAWSVVGGGEKFPTLIGKPRWITPRIFVWKCELKPNHEYWLSINSHTFTNFRSKRGEPVEPYPIAFRTGAPGARTAKKKTKDEILIENKKSVDELRRVIEENYSYRDLRNVDWDKQFARFGPRMEAAETPMEFAKQAGRLLAKAKDIHIWLKVGPASVASHRRRITPNCNLDTLARIVPDWARHNDRIYTGRYPDGIGYIMIASWSSDQPKQLDAAFDALEQMADCKGIIVDVRLNSGGDEGLAQRVAGCFVDEPKLYAKHVTLHPAAEGGFSEPYDRMLEPNPNGPQFRGKIAVLSGPYVMSSCEAFLMMMKAAGGKLVGANSYGSSGNPKPFVLYNGVTVYLPSWKAMQADGTLFEGTGIAPDVPVETKKKDFADGDPVLKAALKLLRK